MKSSTHPNGESLSCFRWTQLFHVGKVLVLTALAALQLPLRILVTRPRFCFWAAAADSTVWLLQLLGPAYVKVGQLLSTRFSELPQVFVIHLGRLQDDVSVRVRTFTLETVRIELGAEVASQFRLIHKIPIAAGCAAVVYRGELSDGRSVAIKVVRRNGYVSTRVAIETIRMIATLISRLSIFSRIPVLDAIDDVAHAMLRQFDLTHEARLTQKVREMFSMDRRVRVPKVYFELSNKNVLIMEFIEGLEKVTNSTDGDAFKESLKVGFQVLFKMILEHGIIHCDFHAGNVFFSKKGVVTVLDMGFMEELTAVETYQFREFFIGIMLNDGRRCARVLVDTATGIDNGCDRESFEAKISDLVMSRTRVATSEFKVVAFVKELFQIQSQHGIRGSHRFTMTILSLLVYEGMATKLVPSIDFQREALPVLGPILVRRGF